MRNDFEASMQLGRQFATEEERQSWKDDEKQISNITHPFSGSERNRLFCNYHGDQFIDLSGLSGVDSPSDGRVSVWFDYDGDGLQDLAVVNSNRPLLQLYRNTLNDRDSAGRNFAAFRFEGASQSSDPGNRISNRDAWGTRVSIKAGDLQVTREHLCGHGFAGQGSATMLVGLGNASKIDHLKVIWPSGRESEFENLPTGRVLVLTEPESDSGSPAEPLDVDYRMLARRETPGPASRADDPWESARLELNALVSDSSEESGTAEIQVVTTMASWCTSCAKHQPFLNDFADLFPPGKVSLVGFPGDPEDDPDAFAKFTDLHQVGYPVIHQPDDALRSSVQEILDSGDGSDVLPSTIILNSKGELLETFSGVPTVSQVRRHLRKQTD